MTTAATAVSVGGPKVYDVTKYLSDHPGGPEIMLDLAGRWMDGS
jgi:cytochrome b involved in lipid metabolism